jgi:hypothetical protein
MIVTEYSNQDGCTACCERKSEVRVELGLERQKLIVRLCAECRVDLVKRLLPAIDPERPMRKPRRPKT